MAVAVRVVVQPTPGPAWEPPSSDASFGQLYSRWRADLVGLCRLQLGSGGDAEAVAQEALVRAWLSLDRYSANRPFWPWVATIARRLCIDQIRRRQCEQRHVYHEYQWQATAPEEPEFEAERQEEHRAALSAFQGLRPREQRLIGRRHIDGWSVEQMAMFEGMSVDATRTALKRAHAALRSSYQRTMSSTPVIAALATLARWRRRFRLMAARTNPTAPIFVASRGGELLMVLLAAATVSGTAPAFQLRAATTLPAAARGRLAGRPDAAFVPSQPFAAAAAVLHATPDRPGSSTSSPAEEVPPTPPAGALPMTLDRGATWTRLPATGFTGDKVLLPPAYPADHRLFASGPTAFQFSDDGGESFKTVGGAGGDAAMSPGFSSGDGRILIGSLPRWVYDDAEQLAHPAEMIVPSSGLTGVPEFAPDVTDGSLVLIGGTTTNGTSSTASAVFHCNKTACTSSGLLPGATGAPGVRLADDFTRSGKAWAWRAEHLFGSSDGAKTFAAVNLPTSGAIRDVRFGPSHEMYLATVGPEGIGGLLRSVDDGSSWSYLYRGGVESFVVLPDGRLIVGLQTGVGIACSDDAGQTWKVRCP
ncbi:MAG: polymerase sigma-70 factor, subfamily [Actinomycetota bacterium]|nr:polymerase sigma-70 factor, subfamily [Actinomycetota bacterium]